MIRVSSRRVSRRGLSSLPAQRRQRQCWTPPTPPPTPAILSSNPSALPFLHSRKKLAPACVDATALKEGTQQVLETPVGDLFAFDRQSRSLDRSSNDRTAAWEAAMDAIPQVEYLMRGHAAQIPGTLWDQWTNGSKSGNSTTTADPLDCLESMDALLERMGEEGTYYMQVRKEHLSQLVWEESLKEEEEDTVAADWRKFAREDTIVDDDEDDNYEDGAATEAEATAHEANFMEANDDEGVEIDDISTENDDTMQDFAKPGPTVDMFDVFLDSLAVTAQQAGDPRQFSARKASNLLTSRHALDIFELLYQRHCLDGGEEQPNDNPYTLLTQISYNAVIRTVANLPYDGQSEVYRDLALVVAFATNDAMEHSVMLEKNSSTYAYLLQVVAKYLPACEFRGNVAHSLWKQAKSSGVYNDQVLEAYLQAHEPSNTAKHDEWLEKNLKGFDWRTEVPQRWRRRVQKFRMIPKQTTY